LIIYRNKKQEEKSLNKQRENISINDILYKKPIPYSIGGEIKILYKNQKLLSFWEKLCFYRFIPNKAKRNFIFYTNRVFDRMLSIEYILDTFSFVENVKNSNLNLNIKSILDHSS